MRKLMQDHMARRGDRRKGRRSRFWTGVASVVIFAVLLSMTVAGLTLVGHESRVVENAEQIVTGPGKGQIVQVGSASCSKADFDNLNGRLSDREYIPCPESRSLNRDYRYPTNRMEKLSKGFFK